MTSQPFVFKIGGEAGFGIGSAGLTFAKIASRSGYHVFDYLEYPSIIRGGHNVLEVCVSEEKIRAPYAHTDFLLALNQETLDRHMHELSTDAIVLFDSEFKMNASKLPSSVTALDIPAFRLAKENGSTILMRDTITLGATIALLEGSLEIFNELIAEEFARKGEEVVKKNQLLAHIGFEYIQKHFSHAHKPILRPKKKTKPQLVINGNEAVALGAIAGGMQFAAIYPMTPTSNILHVLAAHQAEFDFIYKQPEDEISAINMAIGAAFAGARSMVATAGGGFCLMAEGYGLAGMTETPVVMIEGMRGSPATGLPTWTEQGDLRFVLHAHQGDFPRIVLAPGDVDEAFHMTMQAFNLAEIYQTPVVVMIDKHLCESHESTKPFDYHSFTINRGKFKHAHIDNYERYAPSHDGISLRVPAGTGTHVIANSDEHSPTGYSSEESSDRIEQMNKRMQKLETCATKDMPEPTLYGPAQAPLTIVSWGSTKGVILEALKTHPEVNFLHLTWLSPFPTEAVKKILSKAHMILNIELNYSAQLGGLITEKTGIFLPHHLLKYDGRPIFPEEISAKIEELTKNT